MQLTEISAQFEDMGVNITAMTYDSVEMLKSVEEDEGVEFTLLRDADITHVNALGILNEDYEPGSRAYGVPHPGIFIITVIRKYVRVTKCCYNGFFFIEICFSKTFFINTLIFTF